MKLTSLLQTNSLQALVTIKVRDQEKIMALYQDLRRLLLDPNNPRLGTVGRTVASKFGSKMDSICGELGGPYQSLTFSFETKAIITTNVLLSLCNDIGTTGKNLAIASTKDLNVILKLCSNDIQQWATSRKPTDGGLLKAFSPW